MGHKIYEPASVSACFGHLDEIQDLISALEELLVLIWETAHKKEQCGREDNKTESQDVRVIMDWYLEPVMALPLRSPSLHRKSRGAEVNLS